MEQPWLLGAGWHRVTGDEEAPEVYALLKEHGFDAHLYGPGEDEFDTKDPSTQKRVYFGPTGADFLASQQH